MLVRVAVVVACVIGLAAASGEIMKRVTESDPGAVKFRYEMMDIAWQMVEDHPMFGTGINTFVAALPHYGKYGGPKGVTENFGDTWPVVHNAYLIYWSEQGTVGFLLLLGLYGSVLLMGAQSARYMVDDVIYAMNLGACCGLVANMVDGIASFFIAENPSERVFFMLVALIVAINYWTMANRPARVPRPVMANLALRQAEPAPSPA
jgi:putative inorganic carbon (HCO3(-)) transporter